MTQILKKLAISATSAAFLTVVVVGSKLYLNNLGINDSIISYENQLDMWHADTTIGFINELPFSAISFGNIRVQTNEHALRATRPTPIAKTNGVF